MGLYNYGVAAALSAAGVLSKRDPYHTPALFPTLASSPATWSPGAAFDTSGAGGGGWVLASPSRDVVAVTSTFKAAQAAAFVSATAWGPLAANISKYADLAYVAGDTATRAAAGDTKLHLSDFLNWRFAIQARPLIHRLPLVMSP